MKGIKIEWTEEMIDYLKEHFPVEFTTDIAKHLNIGHRTVIRKARELGIDKVEDFHQMNAEKIGKKISKVNKNRPNSGQFKKGSTAGLAYRFKSGHDKTIHTPEQQKQRLDAWRETWLQDCLRFTYGIKKETKFKYNYNSLRKHLLENGSKRENAEP